VSAAISIEIEAVRQFRSQLIQYQVEMTKAFSRSRTANGDSLGSERLASVLREFDVGWEDGRNRLIDSFGAAISMLDAVQEHFGAADEAFTQRFTPR